MYKHEILEKAVEHYGQGHQIVKAMEELGELAQVLAKWKNGAPVAPSVCEEIADVEIMIHQLKIILGDVYEDYLIEKKREKIDRLEARLELIAEDEIQQ